jgi:hypothetical protein
MSQVKFRDLIEDNFQQMASLRATLRDMQSEENRRLKDVANEERNRKFKIKSRLEEIKTNVVNGESLSKHFDDVKKNVNLSNDEDAEMKTIIDESLKKRDVRLL